MRSRCTTRRTAARTRSLGTLGGWKFSDVTQQVGLDHNNHGWSTAASWEDFDRDGDLDLYVANDYGRNNLYRCEKAGDGSVKFTDIAAQVGVEDMTTSMGANWADPNRDGRPDMYVSNMYSSAGQRVTLQKGFKRNIPGVDDAHVKVWQSAAMGNSLFQGTADGSFAHTSAEAGIQRGLWSWGTVFADVQSRRLGRPAGGEWLHHRPVQRTGLVKLLLAAGRVAGPGSTGQLPRGGSRVRRGDRRAQPPRGRGHFVERQRAQQLLPQPRAP